MIKRIKNGYEYFECSKCGEEYNIFDDDEFCNVCGHYFQHFNTHNSFSKNKFIALGFSKGEMNNKPIMLATLKNAVIGMRKFAIPQGEQLSNRIEYFVINGNKGYLEDGLMQDKLVFLEDFIELNIKTDEGVESVLVHKEILNS